MYPGQALSHALCARAYRPCQAFMCNGLAVVVLFAPGHTGLSVHWPGCCCALCGRAYRPGQAGSVDAP
eukprot:1137260-Pelagomonas_calceolata.AAC.9